MARGRRHPEHDEHLRTRLARRPKCSQSVTLVSMNSFSEFWPYYLAQHRRPLCRVLHFVGTSGALSIYTWALSTRPETMLWWLLLAPLFGYGCAWVGHFFVEGNRPATFGHPLWALAADLRLFGRMLTGREWTGDPAPSEPTPAD